MNPPTRRIAITGASSEIGRAIAARLAQPGDHLILHAFRNAASCEALVLPPETTREVIVADFTDAEALGHFCARARDVDLLVNGAAVTRTQLVAQQEEQDLFAMVDVNIKALVAVCKAALPGMVARRRGTIVNLSSVAARRGNRGQAVYAGTKGFVEAFTRALASEYGGRNIRVNAVAPGAIDAGSLKALLDYAADEVTASTAARRLGTPADVAAAVAWLASADAAFVNGTCLAVDGGFSRGVG